MKKSLFFLGIISVISTASAEERGHHLFNPTPEDKLRGINADRPDKTESAYTVDAGHIQIESDLVNYTRDEDESTSTRTTALYINNMNFKVGLTDSSDLQIIIPTYVEQRSRSSASTTAQKGYGETIVRYKHNFIGNNSGSVAIGLMPYVKLPTAGAGLSDERVEGGLIFPVTLKLPSQWELGLTLGIDHTRRSDNRGAQTAYAMSGSLNHSIIGDLAGFVEVYSQASDNRNQGAVMTFDFGFTYLLAPKIQLDTGAFLGITPAADDLTTFLGLTVLF